jgi:hypothetical protein
MSTPAPGHVLGLTHSDSGPMRETGVPDLLGAPPRLASPVDPTKRPVQTRLLTHRRACKRHARRVG